MKLGLICEGVQGGADELVLSALIKRLRPSLRGPDDVDPDDPSDEPDFKILPLENKPNLKAMCGSAAKRLMQTDGCERVGIIWDLYPKWGRDTDCARDHTDVLDSLNKAKVDLARVECLCVVAEIETWFLMDRSAIQTVIKRLAHPHPIKMPSIRKPLDITKPKVKLIDLFKSCRVRKYQEHVHNIQIAAEVNLDRLQRCPSFADFDTRVLP